MPKQSLDITGLNEISKVYDMIQSDIQWLPEKPEPETIIWRYLSFTKLVSMLDSSSIHFTRLDNFSDPFEGSYPLKYTKNRQMNLANSKYPDPDDFIEVVTEIGKLNRKYTEVSCWHESNYESDAMWQLYGDNKAVAIVSTVKQLNESLDPHCRQGYPLAKPGPVTGRINYIDYLNDDVPESLKSRFGVFFTKDKSFEHEKEIRIVRYFFPPHGEQFKDSKPRPNGTDIKCDLKVLVKFIVVSPRAPEWFFNLVRSVTNKYDLSFNVRYSDLRRQPEF